MGSKARWIGVALALGLCSGRAYAGPAEDRAAADALFQEARALAKEGRHAEACPKFAASQALDPRPGRLLALGDCYEKAGQTASGWATFREAEAAAGAAGDEARREEAARRAGELQPRLSKLVIEVEAGARVAGLEVKRNGKVVEAEAWGKPVPVDPGEQRIEAGAPGRKGWAGKMVVEGEGATVRIEVPGLEVVTAEKGRAVREAGGSGGKSRVVIGVGGGLAVIGIGAGIGLFLAGSSALGSALSLQESIPGSACNQANLRRSYFVSECEDLLGHVERADAFRNAGTSLLAVGGSVAIGTLVYALIPNARREKAMTVMPTWGMAAAGIVASGRF